MKPKLLFRGPVTTASGYGVHARQLLRALLASDAFDISVQGTNWGQTPFLSPTTSADIQTCLDLISKQEMEGPNAQYDISVQVTIPNEFQKLAPVNIGVTAGIEVDRVSPEWLIKANENVDLLVVPSRHSAETYARVQYQSPDGNLLRLNKPLVMCPEGVDTTIFNTSPPRQELVDQFKFDAPFNYLCVGLGLDRGMGEDRKNISTLVRWFCERFKGDENVGLVLKVSLVSNSLIDFETVKKKVGDIKRAAGCGEFPRIHLIHGRLDDEQLAALYKHPKVKAFVTLTHGEGFGLPIIEAAACGLPIVATGWSGHLDFLSVDGKKRFVSLDHEMVEIPRSAVWKGVMEEGTRWANPKEEDTKLKLKKLVLSYETPKAWATELAKHISETYDFQKTGYHFVRVLTEFMNQNAAARPGSMEAAAAQMKKDMNLEPGTKTLLYTMPMSAGDVFISTAVVDSLKKKFPKHLIFFGVEQKYADILKGNPNIFQLIPYQPWMQNVPFCEMVFDEVYTPNLAIQTTAANWVHGGKGRRLGNEIAHQCNVPFGEYWISLGDITGFNLPRGYIAFHPGSGKGQHEARNYKRWQDVVSNLRTLTGKEIVQVGEADDPLYDGVIDLRGKTDYNQLANVVANSSCLVGIDSVTMHMAAALERPHVAIFGSSYANSTGPVYRGQVPVMSDLVETPNRKGCEKACYKYQCFVDRDDPCLNEIAPQRIVKGVLGMFNQDFDESKFVEHFPKIAGYTHILNPDSQGFPYVESIKSMLGFCDEVVVVDGGSTDGSLKRLELINDPRLKIYTHEWDWSEPGMDGMQKAYARAMCSVGPNDFLWQQDADEVVHEDDYQKIRKLAKNFPRDADLIHLPVVELWGSPGRVRTDRHSWKWRMSRNNFRITHGINKDARVFDEKTGKTFAKKGMSDGCEYIDIMTGEYIPHKGFYTKELEFLRQKNPAGYGEAMNKFFEQLPSVYHYSWMDLNRKVRNFRDFWDRCWANLYNDSAPVPRFPDVKTDQDVVRKAEELLRQGGEHGPAATFDLRRSNPAMMAGWLSRGTHGASRHLRNNDEQSRPSEEVSPVP